MKHRLTNIVTGAALLGIVAAPIFQASPAQADQDDHGKHKGWTKAHNINARQHRQNARIERGERSGALTGREANRLEHRERNIARVEARDRRSGGKFTAQERRNIQHRLNNTSRAIYNQKHDRQHRHHDRD
ncbi:MAG: hypothetical protein JO316_17325 [Abitibacteriaceae bacterium]|nr:hypothetical protein [Abditibacteriaceae bacterium]MBV9867119.1 hypothetical protein [Abditibacteriaceae bacterium]